MVVLSVPKIKVTPITLSRTLKWAKALEMSGSLIKRPSVA
jgi:hypothetical protein